MDANVKALLNDFKTYQGYKYVSPQYLKRLAEAAYENKDALRYSQEVSGIAIQ